MPVDRSMTEGMAAEMFRLYADLEVELLRLMAKHLTAGLDAPDWQQAKLAELQVFRRNVQRMLTAVEQQAVQSIAATLERAYNVGQAGAQADIDAAGLDSPVPRQAERAMAALVKETRGTITGLRLPLLRGVEDAYRRAVYETVAGTLTGTETRLQSTQRMLRNLADVGVRGFTDKAGRRWPLRTYAEMATRTASAHAMVEGQLDRLEDAGIPLVVVSNSSRECERCRPWEGKVLSRGPVAAVQRNVVTGAMERVQIDGTVEQATSAGLMHPNCTHSLSGYIHGATKTGDATSNPKGYEERQQLREMERNVRKWKQRQAVADVAAKSGDPDAMFVGRVMKARADSKVREWQDAIEAHIRATGLPRKRNRESLTAAR